MQTRHEYCGIAVQLFELKIIVMLQRAVDIDHILSNYNFSKLFLSSCKPFQNCHTTVSGNIDSRNIGSD